MKIQEALRGQITLRSDFNVDSVSLVAGADVSCERRGGLFFACVVVLNIPSFRIEAVSHSSARVTFPYIPGLLSFREGPALVKAFERLDVMPQVILFDGQGIAHQRRFGLAAHLGFLLGVPSVGCAKTRLVGSHEPLRDERGSVAPLFDGMEKVGYVVRTKDGIHPLYVSPGNRIDHEDSATVVLKSTKNYRIPEPIRQAHIFGNIARKKEKAL